ncbi:MAG: helix-turn-helix domain-containing protein [Hymenobacter sp.]
MRIAPEGSAQFLDEDVFRTFIPVPESGVKPAIENTAEEVPVALVLSDALANVLQRVKTIPVVEQVQERYMAQIQLLADGFPHTAAEIADKLNYSGRSVRRDLLQLRAVGVVSVNGYYYQIAWLGI